MRMSKHALVRADSEFVEDRLTPAMMPQAAPVWVDGGVQKSHSLASYLEIPFKYKRLILLCTLLGILAAWLAIVLWPQRYASEAKLKMRVGRESVALDPTATTSSTMTLQKTQQEEIVSALEVLGSRHVAEAVVDELGVGPILSGVLPGDSSPGTVDAEPDGMLARFTDLAETAMDRAKGALNAVLSRTGIRSNISDHELAVMTIVSSLHIDSPVDSTIINIEARAETPQMAQAISKKVTEVFLNEHLDATLTDGSLDFFQAQTRDVEDRLNALVSERSHYMQDHKIVSIEANRMLMQDQLAGINRDLVVAYGDLEEALAQAEDLTSKNEVVDDEIVAMRAEKEDSTWSGMRNRFMNSNFKSDSLRPSTLPAIRS